MSNHLTQAMLECIAACNDCATECGHCFSQMYKEASSNDCPACCMNVRLCVICVRMPWLVTVHFIEKFAHCARRYANGVRISVLSMI
jgi:hypothetical protein